MALKDGERQNNNEDEVRWRGRIGRRTFFGAFGLLVQHNTLDAWFGEVPKGSERFREVPRGPYIQISLEISGQHLLGHSHCSGARLA